MIRPLTDSEINWWKEEWWHEEQYIRLLEGKIPMTEVDSKISSVARIFDAAWGKEVGLHPVHYYLWSRGTQPLQFLLGLGHDLETVQSSIGIKKLIQRIRDPKEFESTLLELTIGAVLAGNGHQIEFSPKLPNGKEADIRCSKNTEQVFIEIKKVRESEAQQAAGEFSSRLLHELMELTRAPGGPLADYRFNVEISPTLLSVFGAGRDVDSHLIDGLAAQIPQDALKRVQAGELTFEIERVGYFSFDASGGIENSGVSSSYAGPSLELRRILRSHLTDAVSQLHPDFPGLVIIQSNGELDEMLSQLIVTSLFTSMGVKSQHVSAVIFLPVTYWMPTVWAMFNAFAISNSDARVRVEDLESFQVLSHHFLSRKVATPGDGKNVDERSSSESGSP